MKIFFSLLLLANIAFVLVQWLLPYEQLVVKSEKIPVAEELQLLTEINESVVAVSDEIELEAETDEVLAVEKIENKQLCFTIGPFKDKTRAQTVRGRYSSKDIKTEIKSNLEKEYLGIMVYIDGMKNRQTAIKTAETLASKGIRDYIIINEPGKKNALSLGVFGLKKNAERLIEKVEKWNYDVLSEPRYRDRTIFWLYNEQSSESDMIQMLDPDDTEKGISQIPRQCS